MATCARIRAHGQWRSVTCAVSTAVRTVLRPARSCGATTQAALQIRWVRPVSACSMATASRQSRGLPMMRDSSTSAVSAPMTQAFGKRLATARALSRASRRTYTPRAAPGTGGGSGTSDTTCLKRYPAPRSRAARAFEREASTMGGFFMRSGGRCPNRLPVLSATKQNTSQLNAKKQLERARDSALTCPWV